MINVLIIIVILIAALAAFHLVYHFIYCRYKDVVGKSHCAKCGHAKICQKYHDR